MSAEPNPLIPVTDRTLRITVVLLFAAWFIDYADRLIINLALPGIGADLALSRGQQGLLVSAFFLAYALCQIPGGILTDRFGAHRVMSWALVSWTLFTVLTGFAWSFALLIVVRFGFGVAEGVFPPAAMKTLVERTTPATRMGAYGLVMSSNSIAAVLCPLLIGPLIAVFGWRSAFFSTAALGLVVVFLMRRWLPAPLPRTEPQQPVTRPPLRDMLRLWVLWRFAGIMFGYNMIAWGLITWAPTYLTSERGLSLASAGALLAIPAVAAALATVIGGRLSDRLRGQQRKVIVPGMTVAAIALLLMPATASVTGFLVLGTLAIFAASLAYMPIFAVPLRGLPAECVGVGSAIIAVGGQLAGIVAPPLIGLLSDHFSFVFAFAFLVLGAVVAAALAILTPQDAESFRAAIGVPANSSLAQENS
ncbi:MAG: hypothetical protein JWN03_2816 [Nocardia sp.]|uniref:MFS transporter n=1 Tax=Nocardia sp. TaxID=1821 RepID=UPI002635B5C1|nr:MFS transporter [Nocardia sp.]MCU1642541.1 hypothetical protein [Nocardia sp.]